MLHGSSAAPLCCCTDFLLYTPVSLWLRCCTVTVPPNFPASQFLCCNIALLLDPVLRLFW
jgi:hypothetical protein